MPTPPGAAPRRRTLKALWPSTMVRNFAEEQSDLKLDDLSPPRAVWVHPDGCPLPQVEGAAAVTACGPWCVLRPFAVPACSGLTPPRAPPAVEGEMLEGGRLARALEKLLDKNAGPGADILESARMSLAVEQMVSSRSAPATARRPSRLDRCNRGPGSGPHPRFRRVTMPAMPGATLGDIPTSADETSSSESEDVSDGGAPIWHQWVVDPDCFTEAAPARPSSLAVCQEPFLEKAPPRPPSARKGRPTIHISLEDANAAMASLNLPCARVDTETALPRGRSPMSTSAAGNARRRPDGSADQLFTNLLGVKTRRRMLLGEEPTLHAPHAVALCRPDYPQFPATARSARSSQRVAPATARAALQRQASSPPAFLEALQRMPLPAVSLA